jgi:tRNA threonylcarbamoyl adenosine modification protein YeaZ/ribosomal-protein-alanine acetyltransferase
MLTLALETATRRGSVATCDDGRRREATQDAADGAVVPPAIEPHICEGRVGDLSRTHGERLPGEVLEWLAARGRTLADVDLFAVVCGPGSFTGLRVGIAAIQGFALAARRPVVSVPTLDAMIATWLPSLSDEGAVVVALLDGQRGEVFASAVDAPGGASLEQCPRLLEPIAARPAELAALLAERFSDRHLVVVCDDARRWSKVVLEAVPRAAIVDMPLSLAESAARIAAAHPERGRPPHAVKPVYVRRPDAVIVRERGQSRESGVRPYPIRRAQTPEDLAAVDALQRQTFTNPWGAEAIRWELENTDVSRLYVMHDAAGALVAYCACWMVFDELHINSLAVDVARRRQGLARRLLLAVLAEAVDAGAKAATLEVRRSNTAARALYEGLGFSIEGVRRDYYQDPREDAVILWKRDLDGGQRATGKGQRL